MAKRESDLTEGEWAIIRAVWRLEPCPAPTVQEALLETTQWSYSTVKTMMDRMAAKGLLTTEKMRNLILYRSAVSRPEAQKREVMRAVKRAFNGALTPMMQFLIEDGELTPEQLDDLEASIQRIQEIRKNAYENQSRGECAAPNEQGKEGERGISPVDMLSEPDAAMRSSPPVDARESFHTRSKTRETGSTGSTGLKKRRPAKRRRL